MCVKQVFKEALSHNRKLWKSSTLDPVTISPATRTPVHANIPGKQLDSVWRAGESITLLCFRQGVCSHTHTYVCVRTHTCVCVCLCVLSVWLSRSVMTLLLQQLLPPQFNLAKLAISSVSSSSSSIHTHARTRTHACVLRGLICHQPLSTSSHHHQGDVFVSLCAPHVSAATDKLESSDDWRYAGLWLVDRAPHPAPAPHPQSHHFYELLSHVPNSNHLLPQMGVTLTQLLWNWMDFPVCWTSCSSSLHVYILILLFSSSVGPLRL